MVLYTTTELNEISDMLKSLNHNTRKCLLSFQMIITGAIISLYTFYFINYLVN